MFDVILNAVSGVRAGSRGMAVAATNIANSLTPDYHPQEVVNEALPTGGVESRVETSPSVGVDLAEEAVRMISSEIAIKANLQVIRSSNQTKGLLLDIHA